MATIIENTILTVLAIAMFFTLVLLGMLVGLLLCVIVSSTIFEVFAIVGMVAIAPFAFQTAIGILKED